MVIHTEDMEMDAKNKKFVKEAIENGYIDYGAIGLVYLYYKGHDFYPFFLPSGEKVIHFFDSGGKAGGGITIVRSEVLHDKLKTMFNAWEAI